MKQMISCKKRILFLLLAAGSAVPQAHGGIPAAFADIGYGARAMGMGGAYVALASDPYAVLWNPACLTDVKGWQASFMHARQFGLIPYTWAGIARGMESGQGAGLAALSSGDDALRETTLLAAYGYRQGDTGRFRKVSAGLTLKLRLSTFGNNADGGENRITGSALGFGFDFGLRWKPASAWAFGLMLRDFWNRVQYENRTLDRDYGEAVPAALIAGTAFMPRDNLVFAFDLDKSLYRDVITRMAAGFEWFLFKAFFLRAGWSQHLRSDPMRKWNWGVGIQHFRRSFGVRFDFAYQTYFLASTPRVSVSLWF